MKPKNLCHNQINVFHLLFFFLRDCYHFGWGPFDSNEKWYRSIHLLGFAGPEILELNR